MCVCLSVSVSVCLCLCVVSFYLARNVNAAGTDFDLLWLEQYRLDLT